MKLRYDPKADALIVHLSNNRFYDSIEAAPGVQIDVDSGGQPIRVEVLDVQARTETIEMDLSAWSEHLPLSMTPLVPQTAPRQPSTT